MTTRARHASEPRPHTFTVYAPTRTRDERGRRDTRDNSVTQRLSHSVMRVSLSRQSQCPVMCRVLRVQRAYPLSLTKVQYAAPLHADCETWGPRRMLGAWATC